MASFLADLVSSIFTPGPTPTLITATNVSFAALQVVLFVLLVATFSVHFVILSFLSAFLWYAINWFVQELEAAQRNEQESRRAEGSLAAQKHEDHENDSGDETEGVGEATMTNMKKRSNALGAEKKQAINLSSSLTTELPGDLRKRRSIGEQSAGDLSTDSEWDKIGDSEGDISGRSSQE